MKKISLLLVAMATLFLASCESKESKTTDEQTVETEAVAPEVTTPAYVGTYEGTLPAADAAGLSTKLTLKEDGTYELYSAPVDGKEDYKLEVSGVYNLLDNDVIELVAPSTNDKTYYKVMDNAVALVADASGTLNEGELAEHYILNKVVE